MAALTLKFNPFESEFDFVLLESTIDHTKLVNIGFYTHPQIDAHIDSVANPHVVTQQQTYEAGSDITLDGTEGSVAILDHSTPLDPMLELQSNNGLTQYAAFGAFKNLLPGTGLASTVIGVSSTASGQRGVAIGEGNEADQINSTIVGTFCGTTGGNSVTIGVLSTAGPGCIAMGRSASAPFNQSISIGDSSSCIAVTGVAIGNNPTASTEAVSIGDDANAGIRSTAVGPQNNASGTQNVAIGYNNDAIGSAGILIGASNNFPFGIGGIIVGTVNTINSFIDSSVIIGHNLTSTADRECLIGNNFPGLGLVDFIIGTGRASIFNDAETRIRTSQGSGLNRFGTDMRLIAGTSTGSGSPGELMLNTGTASASGTGGNVTSERVKITNNGITRFRTSLESPVKETAVSYLVTNLDNVILVDASSGPLTITLQSPGSVHTSNSGRHNTVKKVDSSTNAVTVVAGGGALIDGLSSIVLLTENDSIMVRPTETVWNIISDKRFTTNIETAIETVTINTTLGDTHGTVEFDATSGDLIATLPAASSVTGRAYSIAKINSNANKITITADGSDLIHGESTQDLFFQWDSARLQSDGTGWILL